MRTVLARGDDSFDVGLDPLSLALAVLASAARIDEVVEDEVQDVPGALAAVALEAAVREEPQRGVAFLVEAAEDDVLAACTPTSIPAAGLQVCHADDQLPCEADLHSFFPGVQLVHGAPPLVGLPYQASAK